MRRNGGCCFCVAVEKQKQISDLRGKVDDAVAELPAERASKKECALAPSEEACDGSESDDLMQGDAVKVKHVTEVWKKQRLKLMRCKLARQSSLQRHVECVPR